MSALLTARGAGGGPAVGDALLGREDGDGHAHPVRGWAAAALSLGALGVVYGDIGTSPLYTVQVIFGGTRPLTVTPLHVYGALSLIFWSLMTIVTVKYVLVVMRAANQSEGGIIALVALVERTVRSRKRGPLIVVGILGASLFYGDGMITPAISVLSAIEGLNVASPSLAHQEVPIAVVILVALFCMQRFGTGAVGALFGPVMAVWFAVIGACGLTEVLSHPAIVQAVSPLYGARFLAADPTAGFLSLGAVVLAVTGAEALYADMGHFGRPAITRAWLGLVLPALLLNYAGQGALVLSRPSTIDSPFFRMTPAWAQLPMVVLATVATVIASQAVISGAYSITRQLAQLGFLPRVSVRHTSSTIMGQIYVPAVNWFLLAAVIVLVLGFRTSSHLASAYGIAVTGTFATTTLLASVVFRARYRRPLWQVLPFAATLLTIELAFFVANLPKVESGGWLPLAVGAVVFTTLTTWRRGQAEVARADRDQRVPLRGYLNKMIDSRPTRVPGTAVFLIGAPGETPPALIRNVDRNHVTHEQVVLLEIRTVAVPQVPDDGRVELRRLRLGFVEVVARVGYQEAPDVLRLLETARAHGLEIDLDATSFFLDHAILQATGHARISRWRKRYFLLLHRNATPAGRYLHIPAEAILEVGRHIEI